jgi:hypothetical protein
MKVSLEKAFSILDGRLSTNMEDVYEMLNYIFDTGLFTHQIPEALNTIRKVNPKWFASGVTHLEEIRSIVGTNDFEPLINYIKENYSSSDYDIELGKLNSNIGLLSGLF